MAAVGPWRAGMVLLALLALGLGRVRAEQTEEHLKREHSLSKPYQGVGSAGSGLWDLLGNAMVMTQFIRLTPDVQSKQGAVWNRVPCYLRDWEMQVHFKIHGQGKKNLNGDGFAIWYTKDRMQPGPVFGSKDNFLGLGVFVDTYPNEEKQQEAQKRRYSPGNQVLAPAVPPLRVLGQGIPSQGLQESLWEPGGTAWNVCSIQDLWELRLSLGDGVGSWWCLVEQIFWDGGVWG
ncbi:VIP36-like protein [Neopelma chrysocephalum]|uniref:VIP36-like protein n=1 Tax=Neopelma chrysocephalum TaxID=114329 RepID=UPI000FCCF3C6|nr:VIP36-like protein [Neopelma chrysocephalum]XP_027529318.1 VIP36-like protein [Neopelma chrysocephalum]